MSSEPVDVGPIMSLLKSHRFKFWLLVCSLLAVIGWGIYVFYLENVYGLGLTGDRVPDAWGLNIIDFVFFIAISMAGTIISGALRVSNAAWRRPITRIAETITVAALPIGALFPMLDLGVFRNAINLMLYPRLQSPIAWDMIALSTYGIASVIYFYLPLIPDLAVLRDTFPNVSRGRRWLYKTLALNWKGSTRQQDKLKTAIKVMAVMVVPIAVTVHSVLAWVFAVTLRTELHSTIFPIFFVVGAVYSGMATILVVVIAFRRFYHLEQYIQVKHIMNLAYIFLAANLVMIYLTVTELVTPAWTSETEDVAYINSLLTGVYAPYFWFMIIGGFLLPAFIMGIRRTRNALGFIVIAALLADAGMWIERYLLVIPALAVPELPYPSGIFVPTWEDVSITAAGLAAFVLIMVIISRIVPIISIWELSEGAESSVSAPFAAPMISASAQPSAEKPAVSAPSSRRTFLKTGFLAALGIGAGAAASAAIIPEVTAKQPSQKMAKAGPAKVDRTAALGTTVSLEEARSTASFGVSTPSNAPGGASLQEARITSDGGMVTLLYSGSSLEPLSIYENGVSMAVFQLKDDVMKGPPSYLPDTVQRLTVNGNPGYALAASPATGQSGQIQWWSNGRRMSILANLSIPELKQVAESMETTENE